MSTEAKIREFLGQQKIAVAGVSRRGGKPGRHVYDALKEQGRQVYALNPNADEIDGDPCYSKISQLPEAVGLLVIVTKKDAARQIVADAVAADIKRIWLQMGSQSDEAVKAAQEGGADVIAGRCLFLDLEPVRGVHAIHRFFAKLFGRLYK